MLRAILRAGAFELMFRKDVPARVVITEYVDVTHGFYGEDEPGLVNAVLDAVTREVRPGELELRCYAATGCAEHADNPPLEDWLRATEQPDGTWKWEVLLD